MLPEPTASLLLATATMSPMQVRVRPVMTATRRPCTLFIPTLILTRLRAAEPNVCHYCQHSPVKIRGLKANEMWATQNMFWILNSYYFLIVISLHLYPDLNLKINIYLQLSAYSSDGRKQWLPDYWTPNNTMSCHASDHFVARLWPGVSGH